MRDGRCNPMGLGQPIQLKSILLFRVIPLSICLGFLVFVGVRLQVENHWASISYPALFYDPLPETSRALVLLVENDYSSVSGVTSMEYYGWKVVEPYRETTLSALGGSNKSHYEWVVTNQNNTISLMGNPVYFQFTDIGEQVVVLFEYPSDMNLEPRSITTVLVCKYVRRELRSLSDQDREACLCAIMILQRVSTEVGQVVYGNTYFSKDYFNRVHQFYGGGFDCDHWHQGAGFVTSHMAFNLMYERSLQAVDPSVSIPYWDFTLESTFYEPENWRDSPIFGDDWFGEASPDNELHIVTDGRWGFNAAMTRAQNYTTTNSYGILRSPWNHDPTPFMTRHDHLYGYFNNLKPSGCAQYHTTLKSDNWMHLSHMLNAAAHGHIHETVGGSWDNIYPDWLDGEVSPAVYTFAHSIQPLARMLWRADLLQCPEHCPMSMAPSECMCTCSKTALAGRPSYEILDSSGILESVEFFDADGHLLSSFYNESTEKIEYSLSGYTVDKTMHIYDGLLKLSCAPGKIGDNYDSSSPNDLTFWFLHPTIDRLWHYMRLSKRVYNETWDPYHTCYGHNPDDLQPFKNLFDNNNEYYTNSELYTLLHPKNIHLPYMYDNFEWPHCEMQGYNMKAFY